MWGVANNMHILHVAVVTANPINVVRGPKELHTGSVLGTVSGKKGFGDSCSCFCVNNTKETDRDLTVDSVSTPLELPCFSISASIV